jgi:hypothetical protein
MSSWDSQPGFDVEPAENNEDKAISRKNKKIIIS